tara:strand:- start:1054 stop:1272 length:219 start_codon:yes stop_codon:yes gene_type:complete
MTDIKSTLLKDILSKKLNKAKDGISQILKDKSFKAIEDYKKSFQFVLPLDDTTSYPEVSNNDLETPEVEPVK